jgi:hypothetical protein
MRVRPGQGTASRPSWDRIRDRPTDRPKAGLAPGWGFVVPGVPRSTGSRHRVVKATVRPGSRGQPAEPRCSQPVASRSPDGWASGPADVADQPMARRAGRGSRTPLSTLPRAISPVDRPTPKDHSISGPRGRREPEAGAPNRSSRPLYPGSTFRPGRRAPRRPGSTRIRPRTAPLPTPWGRAVAHLGVETGHLAAPGAATSPRQEFG